MKLLRCLTCSVVFLLPGPIGAQVFSGIELPKMPHIDVRVPEIRIPKIEMPDNIVGIPIGHRTNKWEVRHNLERDGWWVAYGKEIGYQEYYAFSQAIVASIATENPGPAMAYLSALVSESVRVLAMNAGARFGNELRTVAERELVSVLYDAIQNGRVHTIRLRDVEVQLGVATYNRSESGVPLPNTHQPYMRMRLVIGGPESGSAPRYLWVTTVYNDNEIPIRYGLLVNNQWLSYDVAPHGWRWHSTESSRFPNFKIRFDTGKSGPRDYDLNSNRLFLGTQASESLGEPYSFGHFHAVGWDLYRGRPRRGTVWEVQYDNRGEQVVDRYSAVGNREWERVLTVNGRTVQQYRLPELMDCPVHVDIDDRQFKQVIRLRSNGDMDIFRRDSNRWDTGIYNGTPRHGWIR